MGPMQTLCHGVGEAPGPSGVKSEPGHKKCLKGVLPWPKHVSLHGKAADVQTLRALLPGVETSGAIGGKPSLLAPKGVNASSDWE